MTAAVFDVLLTNDPLGRVGNAQYTSAQEVAACYEANANLIISACTDDTYALLRDLTPERTADLLVNALIECLGFERISPHEAALRALGGRVLMAMQAPVLKIQFRSAP